MSCYKNHRSIPQKLEIVRRYFSKIELNSEAKILDVKGISSYYEILKVIFPRKKIFLLNNNSEDVKGVNNSIAGDAIQLPFKKETFDVITSFDMIEHLINPDDFLAESSRILKWRGWFVVSTPNLADFYSRLTFLFGYTPFSYDLSIFRVAIPFSKVIETDRGHKSVFTYKGLKRVLLIRGLEVIKSEGYCYCDLNADMEKRKREAGFYRFRERANKLLPNSMRKGMLFICRKVSK